MGCGIVTGGGPGLMEAANEGAALAGPAAQRWSAGIRVHLPFEQEANAFVGRPLRTPYVLFETPSFRPGVGRVRCRPEELARCWSSL